jgi:hypothetical protein
MSDLTVKSPEKENINHTGIENNEYVTELKKEVEEYYTLNKKEKSQINSYILHKPLEEVNKIYNIRFI